MIMSTISVAALIGLSIVLETKKSPPKTKKPILKRAPVVPKATKPKEESYSGPKTEFDLMMEENRKANEQRTRHQNAQKEIRRATFHNLADQAHRVNLRQK